MMELLKILLSNASPIGKVVDYKSRTETQQRGSVHEHGLYWVENAPQIGVDDDETVVNFLDKHLSCSLSFSLKIGTLRIPTELRDLPQKLQLHRHTSACLKAGRLTCKYGFPYAPMETTCILRPLTNNDIKEKVKSDFKIIMSEINKLPPGKNCTITFDEFLMRTNLSIEDYILAVRSSIKRTTVFLRRSPSEVRVNAYNPALLFIWRANMDIQLVTDVYAVIKYICSYIAKAQKGMSKILAEACKAAIEDPSISEQLKGVASAFVRGEEVCAQEAALLLLELKITRSSRSFKFINTERSSSYAQNLWRKLPQ